MDDQDTPQERERQYTPESLRQRWVDISEAAMEEFDDRSQRYIDAIRDRANTYEVGEWREALLRAITLFNTARAWLRDDDAPQGEGTTTDDTL